MEFNRFLCKYRSTAVSKTKYSKAELDFMLGCGHLITGLMYTAFVHQRRVKAKKKTSSNKNRFFICADKLNVSLCVMFWEKTHSVSLTVDVRKHVRNYSEISTRNCANYRVDLVHYWSILCVDGRLLVWVGSVTYGRNRWSLKCKGVLDFKMILGKITQEVTGGFTWTFILFVCIWNE